MSRITYKEFQEELTKNNVGGGLIEDGTALETPHPDFTYYFMGGRGLHVWYANSIFIYAKRGIFGEGETLDEAINNHSIKYKTYKRMQNSILKNSSIINDRGTVHTKG